MTSVTDVSAGAKASFCLAAAHVLHEVWPVGLQVLGCEGLAAEESRRAQVPDGHQDDTDQDRRRTDDEDAADAEERRQPVVVRDRVLAVADQRPAEDRGPDERGDELAHEVTAGTERVLAEGPE